MLKVNVSMNQTKSTAKGITKSLEEAEITSRMTGMVGGKPVQISVKKTVRVHGHKVQNSGISLRDQNSESAKQEGLR